MTSSAPAKRAGKKQAVSSQDQGAAERAEEAFQHYLDMERPRSIRRLRAILERREGGKAPSYATLFRWSSVYGWDRRAAEEDAKAAYELRERRRKERVDEMARREKRTLTQSDIVLDGATAVFFDVKGRQPIPFSAIPVEEKRFALQAMKTMREQERLEYGLPTSRNEHTGADGEPLPTGGGSQTIIFGVESLEAMERFLVGPDNDPPRAKVPVRRMAQNEIARGTVIDQDEGIILE